MQTGRWIIGASGRVYYRQTGQRNHTVAVTIYEAWQTLVAMGVYEAIGTGEFQSSSTFNFRTGKPTPFGREVTEATEWWNGLREELRADWRTLTSERDDLCSGS